MDLPTINYLSICAGAGGLDIGVALALPNARCVCVIEIEAYACELLATRMETGQLDAAPIWTDIRTFDGKPWRASVDCIIGGIPCQPHSVAGKRLGVADERDLWPDAKRIIGEIGPAIVFLENVGGATRYFLGTVAAELGAMGYRVAAGLFSAAEVGASHERERLFMLAYREHAIGRMDLEGKVAKWTTPQAHDVTMRGSGQQPTAKAGNACLARDASQWATPNTGDGKRDGKPGNGHQSGVDLNNQAAHWKTPHGMSGIDRNGKSGAGGEFAKQVTNWPTPKGRDHKGQSQRGRHGPNMVCHFSPLDPESGSGGKKSLSDGPTSSRQLNPAFVEMLQGICIGWTNLDCLEIPYAHYKALLHAQFWRLLCARVGNNP